MKLWVKILKHVALTTGFIFALFWVMEVWMFALVNFYGFTVGICDPLTPFRWFCATGSSKGLNLQLLIQKGHLTAYVAGIAFIGWLNLQVWRS